MSPTPSGPTADRPDPAGMPYEAARDELVETVRRLESGSTDLEESLALWERGEALAARCQEVLDGALQRLDATRGGARAGGAAGRGRATPRADPPDPGGRDGASRGPVSRRAPRRPPPPPCAGRRSPTTPSRRS